MSDPATTTRPLRADAERNRLRILEAAGEVFAERGLSASVDEVAARAGVGVGTVYRRFAEKELLIESLFEQRIGELVAIGEHALELEDPWEGLTHFIDAGSAFHARNRALRELIFESGERREWITKARARLKPITDELVTRGQASGQVRDDLVVFDVPLIDLMLAGAMDHTERISPELWRRLLQIVLDGLRRSRAAPTPLPAAPLDEEQLDRIMGGGRSRR